MSIPPYRRKACPLQEQSASEASRGGRQMTAPVNVCDRIEIIARIMWTWAADRLSVAVTSERVHPIDPSGVIDIWVDDPPRCSWTERSGVLSSSRPWPISSSTRCVDRERRAYRRTSMHRIGGSDFQLLSRIRATPEAARQQGT